MARPVLSIIAAVARNGAIGKHNALLVHLPDDLPRFKRLTMGAPLLMGRKTWDSIGRPLPGRRSIVITRNPAWQAQGAEPVPSLEGALQAVQAAPRVFVIGGAQIYGLALPLADELLLTEIEADYDGDAFFPRWNRAGFCQTSREDMITPQGLRYRFAAYRKIEAV